MTNEKNVDQSSSGAFMRAREIFQKALKERGLKGSDVFAEIMAERDAERLERAEGKERMRMASDEQIERAKEILASIRAKDASDEVVASLKRAIEVVGGMQYNTLNDREPVGYLAVMTTHHCPQVTHGGFIWSTVLTIGAECPVCGETESL